MQLLKLLLYTFVLPALAIETMQDPLSKQEPLPEQLFLDYRISDVLDESIRIPKVDPWASEYCAAITEKRYGDAIWARYHMSGNAIDGVITYLGELDDGSCGEYKVNVYDEIMEDAYGYALSSSDCYREALEFYSHSSPRDSRRDILEGLAMVKVSMVCGILS
jgi:hypothetical protein